jgi:hypothetical protein
MKIPFNSTGSSTKTKRSVLSYKNTLILQVCSDIWEILGINAGNFLQWRTLMQWYTERLPKNFCVQLLRLV